MSFTSALSSPSLTIPIHYDWLVDRVSYSQLLNRLVPNLHSPLFGYPTLSNNTNTNINNNHNNNRKSQSSVNVKLRLHLKHEDDSITTNSLYLQLVKCEELAIGVHYQVMSDVDVLVQGYTTLSRGKCELIWRNIHLTTDDCDRLIRCEFTCIQQFNQLKSLLDDFSALRLKPEDQFSDVTFDVRGREFAAHKNILSARSPVFRAMFTRADWAENQHNRVHIVDIEPVVFKALLDYVYTGKSRAVDRLAFELIRAANKYDIPKLVELCEQKLQSSLTIENACRILSTADEQGLTELKWHTIHYINHRPTLVMATDGWLDLIANNATLVRELYTDLAFKQQYWNMVGRSFGTAVASTIH